MPSLPADAKRAPDGWLGGSRQSARTTSLVPVMVWRSFPVISKTRICLSAHPVCQVC